MPSQAASGGVFSNLFFHAESKYKYADWKAPAHGVNKIHLKQTNQYIIQ